MGPHGDASYRRERSAAFTKKPFVGDFPGGAIESWCRAPAVSTRESRATA